MSLKTTELNKLHKLKQKVSLLHLDIQFLKKCKQNKLFPKFIKINIPIKNLTTNKVLYDAKMNWLNLEIKNLYAKRANIELQAMEQHLKITKQLLPEDYNEFEQKFEIMLRSIEFKSKNKLKKLENKFNNLKQNQNPNTTASHNNPVFPNQCLVYNKSTSTFTNEEINLLNKGLNFNFKSKKDVNSLIIDIETNIKYLDNNKKTEIRSDIFHALIENKNNSRVPASNDIIKYDKTLKKLQEKDVYFLKADKGNSIVIIDKGCYDTKVNDMLKEGPYKICPKNPITKFTTSALESLKHCKTLIPYELRRKLTISNPVLPRLYCLPKVHKPGLQMRPIVSSIDSPTYLLSKWLQNKLQQFTKFPSFSVKNRYEFIDAVKNVQLEENEYLVSFDVIALYPSVPIETTIVLIKDWLTTTNLNDKEIEEYMILTTLCMKQNTFQFNDKFFSQIDGTAMGNPLSCFTANIFMSHFELLAKESLPYFPRIWLRYVDDVFAVFDKRQDIQSFIQQLNSIYPSIKFTFEIESKQSLPFLDLLVIRNSNHIEFDIFRKPSHTDRYITNESYHPPAQKRSVFHSLIFRLLNTPLTPERFNKELIYIKDVAKFNGYETSLIDNMLRKAKQRHEKRSRTKLLPIKEDSTEFISTTYTNLSNQVKKTFRKHTNKIISFRTKNNLKKKLINPKDKIKEENMSGIYEISCNDCNKKYIGQTKRNIKTRFKEHLAHLKYNRSEKSAVASHCIHTGHSLSQNNIKIIKQINSKKELDAWETYYINIKNKEELMNNEDGPIQNSQLLEQHFIKYIN